MVKLKKAKVNLIKYLHMEFQETKLKDVKLIKPQVFGDHRGFFLESYSKKKFQEVGIENEFVQDNHSKSEKRAFCADCTFKNRLMPKLSW